MDEGNKEGDILLIALLRRLLSYITLQEVGTLGMGRS